MNQSMDGIVRTDRNYNGLWGTCCGIDVSLDVVPAIEVARLTRWQLLFEPYRNANAYGGSGGPGTSYSSSMMMEEEAVRRHR